jgi:PEP-CTERM motif-containing protein
MLCSTRRCDEATKTGAQVMNARGAVWGVPASVRRRWILAGVLVGASVGFLAGFAAPAGAGTITFDTAAGATYANANGSIAGNGPDNPFLAGDVTLTHSVAAVTATSFIDDVPGGPTPVPEPDSLLLRCFLPEPVPIDHVPGGPTPVPEPDSLLLLVSGLVAVGAWSRKRRANSKRELVSRGNEPKGLWRATFD